MKAAVLCLTLISIASEHAAKKMHENFVEDEDGLSEEQQGCIAELNLDENVILAQLEDSALPEKDTDFNAFLECYCKKAGVMNERGELNYGLIMRQYLDAAKDDYDDDDDEESNRAFQKSYKEQLTHAVETCKRNVPRGSNRGEYAAATYNCISDMLYETLEL